MKKPLLLHYYVTTRCNASCAFCDIWKGPTMPDAAVAEVSDNLAQARKRGCRFVDFTGGEPLLNKELPLFLGEAKRNGYITSVTTNCLLFPARAKELAGRVDLLHFSIHMDTPEQRGDLRRVPSFSNVAESVAIALENDLFPDLLLTYTNQNLSAFEAIYTLAREKKLMLIIDPVFSVDSPDPLSTETHRTALEYAKRPGVYLNRSHLDLRAKGGNRCRAPLCRAVDSSVVILPDNTLALPCFHHRTEALPIHGNLSGLLSGPVRLEAAKMQGRHPFCEHCHINCYFDPSYAYMRNRLFLMSMAAKLRYAWRKYIVYRRPIPGK